MCAYAINSRSSFDEILSLRENILRAKDEDKVPMVLIGNKCDLDKERQVSTYEGKELAKSFGCPFYETSALSRVNVEVSFFDVVREIRKIVCNTKSQRQKGSKKSLKKNCNVL